MIASNNARFQAGDVVLSRWGWREACNTPAEELQKIDAEHLAPEAYLGVAGLPGLSG